MARQCSECFPSFFLFLFTLERKRTVLQRGILGGLTGPRGGKAGPPSTHPCCSARDSAGPAPHQDPTWLLRGEQRAGGSSLACPAPTAAANPPLPPLALSHHRPGKASWRPARVRDLLLLCGCRRPSAEAWCWVQRPSQWTPSRAVSGAVPAVVSVPSATGVP